jgi:hypothetical protein
LKNTHILPVFAVLIAVTSILSHGAYGFSTTTFISSSANPSPSGQPITFTATVSPSNGTIPDGETVTFLDDNTTIGTSSTATDVATFTTSALSLGTHFITASYAGDINNTASTSSALTQTVNQSATTTYVYSSANPSPSGQPVTFTATVYTSSYGAIPDGETVTFLEGNTTIGTGNTTGSVATFTTSALSLGTHSITASYAGDTNDLASTSGTLTQTISQITTATSIYSSSNPSSSGQPVTFTATVYPSYGAISDGETVTFLEGDTVIGTGSTTGNVATFTTSALSLGTHSISASYAGDTDYLASTSGTVLQTVHQSTTTTISSSPSSSTYGQPITFTATVSPSNGTIPDGETVTFLDGYTTIGAGTTATGVATFTASLLSVGTHSITASYSGDTNDAPSTSTVLTQVVNKSATQITGNATKCSGLASCTYAISGGSASASAGVGGYVGQSPLLFSRGSVSFLLPGESTVTYATGVYNGQAVLSGYSSTAGTLYTVTGQFSAIDSNTGKIVTGSTHDVIGIKGHSGRGGGIYFTLVNGSIGIVPTNVDGTKTTVTCNPTSVTSGNASTCTVNVTDSASSSNAPTGTVSLSASNTGLGTLSSSTCTLLSGSCSVVFKTNHEAGGGTTSIYASYNGDGTHYTSASSTSIYVTAPSGDD